MLSIESVKSNLKKPNILLRKARLERGWSQQEVARLTDVPQTFMISRWEGGTSVPNAVYRERLCVLFGRSGAELGFPESVPSFAPHVLDSYASIYDPAIPVHLANGVGLVGRDNLHSQLKSLLCAENEIHLLALNGLPGVGKTDLAAYLASDPEIRSHFNGGILWAELGQQPQLITHFRRWGSLFSLTGQECSYIADEQEWRQTLRRLIGGRRMLIIIDDAWSLKDALKCMVGEQCSYILTTRNARIASSFAEEHAFRVPELNQADGVRLLCRIVPFLAKTEIDAVHEIVLMVGGLPLALNLLGKYLLVEARYRQPRRIQSALQHLLKIETRFQIACPRADFYQSSNTAKPFFPNLQSAIEMSVAPLDKIAQQALYALSIFPAKPNSFSESAALAVSNVSATVLDDLVDRGLLEVCKEGRYQLHQTIADYARLYLSGKKAAIEERMIRYWVDLVKQYKPSIQKIKTFELEAENVLTALELACKRTVPDC